MPETMKIMLLGGNYVGKTTLAARYCEDKFLETTIVTVGVQFYSKLLNIKGDILKIFDTPSQRRFMKPIMISHCESADALIFVYDVTDSSSLESAKDWIEECKYSLSNYPFMLTLMLGTKCDMEDEREVQISAAQQIGNKYNMEVYEVTLKLDSGQNAIDSIFTKLAEKYKHKKLAECFQLYHRFRFEDFF